MDRHSVSASCIQHAFQAERPIPRVTRAVTALELAADMHDAFHYKPAHNTHFLRILSLLIFSQQFCFTVLFLFSPASSAHSSILSLTLRCPSYLETNKDGCPTMATAATDKAPRERKLSTHAPIATLQGPVGPGFTRPKHKRTGRSKSCKESPKRNIG